MPARPPACLLACLSMCRAGTCVSRRLQPGRTAGAAGQVGNAPARGRAHTPTAGRLATAGGKQRLSEEMAAKVHQIKADAAAAGSAAGAK